MIMYLNVSINYLSNINCKFVMRFGYHDNLLRIRNSNKLILELKNFICRKKKTITLYKSLNNIDHLKKE